MYYERERIRRAGCFYVWMVFLSHPPFSNHSGHLCVLAPSSASGLGFISNQDVSVLSCFSCSLSCHRGIQVDRAPRCECQIRYVRLFFLSFLHVLTCHRHFLPRSCVNLRPYSVFRQPPGGIPGSQPLLPNSLDPTRPQGETGAVWIDSIWSG